MLKDKFIKSLITMTVFVALIVSITIEILIPSTDPLKEDMFAFHLGAKIVKDGKSSELYNIDTQSEYANKIADKDEQLYNFLSFRNPPVFAYLFLPIANLDLISAYKALGIANIIFSITGIYFIKRIFGVSFSTYTIALLYVPTIYSILTGQFTVIFALTLVLIYKLLKENHNIIAGILVIILSLKPQYLIYWPFLFLIADRKSIFSIASIISLGMMYFLNRLLYGPGLILDYLNFIKNTENLLYGTRIISNFNLLATVSLLNKNMYIPTLIIQLAIIIEIIVWLYLKRNKISTDFILIIGIIFGLTLNVHTMGTDLLLFLIPIFILAKDRKYKKWIIFLYLSPILGFFRLEGISALINFQLGIYVLSNAEEKKTPILQNNTNIK